MDNLIVLSVSIGIVYFFARFIEMRFIKHETAPLKNLFKDSAFVLISAALGGFIVNQIGGNILNSDMTNAISGGDSTPAFTGKPDF